MEEQTRQKLQLDKVAAESKIKKLEETLALNEDSSAKVSAVALIFIRNADWNERLINNLLKMFRKSVLIKILIEFWTF